MAMGAMAPLQTSQMGNPVLEALLMRQEALQDVRSQMMNLLGALLNSPTRAQGGRRTPLAGGVRPGGMRGSISSGTAPGSRPSPRVGAPGGQTSQLMQEILGGIRGGL